jgi:hypothetical protein
MSQKGEEKEKISQLPDYSYDNRLSRESQLDDNLKSLVRSRPVSQAFNQMSTHLDTVSGEENDGPVVKQILQGGT